MPNPSIKKIAEKNAKLLLQKNVSLNILLSMKL